MSSGDDTAAPQPASGATAAQGGQGSFHTGGVASAGGAAAAPEGGGYREKEPAPSYDGLSPETTFRQYEKNIRLWQFESEIPARKQGVKMMRSLSGLARLAVDDMEFDEIACESGAKNVLAKLREYFLPHLEVSLPRAFEAAVYGNARSVKESFAEYVQRMDRAFTHLSKEGVDLPRGATGYIMYRQASLSEAQDQRVLTWCEGSYNREDIIKALRRLDKVIKDGSKGSRASYVQDNVEAFAVEEEIQEEEESEGGEHIFLADGDLDQVYDEGEVKEALASYRETRQALKAQRTNRGFFPTGFKKDGFKGYGKGKSKGKKKVHIEQLKLRSRCWNCGAVGHWSEECKLPRTSSSKGPTSSSGASSQTGFYVASSNAENNELGEGLEVEDREIQNRNFWLRAFVEENRYQVATSEDATNSASSWAYKERRDGREAAGSFCGIVTKPSQGIVDTAAEGGLIGSVALQRHEEELRSYGLKCKWIPKVSSAKGVGGSAKVVGVTLIPLGIGKVNGILEATVVEGEVPLLLPVRMLKALGAVIDLQNDTMKLMSHNVTVQLETMASGHVAVDVTQFADGKFQAPHEVGSHEEFHLPPCHNSAMLAQLKSDNLNSKASSTSGHVHFLKSNGVADREASSGSSAWGTRAAVGPAAGASREACPSELAGYHGQSDHIGHFGGPSRCSKRLVSFAIGAVAVLGTRGDCEHYRGRLLPDHSRGKTIGTAEECYYIPYGGGKCMHPPQEGVEGWGQRFCELRGVQAMPLQVGMPLPSSGSSKATEARCGPLEQEDSRKDADLECDGGRRGGVEGEGFGACNAAGFDGSFEQRGAEEVGVGAEEHETGGKRERAKAREDDADGDGRPTTADASSAANSEGTDGANGEDVTDGGRTENTVCEDSGQSQHSRRSTVQLRGNGRKIGGEERRTEEREVLLQVPSEEVRVLSMGSRGDSNEEQERKTPVRDGELGGSVSGLPIHSDSKSAVGWGTLRRDEESVWCSCTTKKAQLWAKTEQRRTQLGEEGGLQVMLGYRRWSQELGEWEDREGYVEVEPGSHLQVRTRMSDRLCREAWFEELKETSFKRPERRKVERALERIEKSGQGIERVKSEENYKVDVSEVYSPPRMVEEARRQRMRGGTSFDLTNGWDLTDEESQKKMWKALIEEDPWLIVLSPPCTAFSKLQLWNFPRMKRKKVIQMLQLGVAHLELVCEIIKWQINRGGYVVFEHPRGASSWEQECIQEVLRMEGMMLVECDMCEFGLNVTGEGLNKKPTTLATNSPCIAKKMARKCKKDHFHVPLLHGLAKKAQEYTPKFCEEMMAGFKEQIKSDKVTPGRHQVFLAEEVFAEEDEEEDLEEALDREIEEEEEIAIASQRHGEAPQGRAVSQAEKNAVMKLHKNVGHPNKKELIRFMRAARVKGDVIKWTKDEFNCPTCEAKAQPKVARSTTIPRSYQPNRVVGLDLVFIPDVGGGKKAFPALSVVDWGTNFQVVQRIAGKHPKEVWHTFLDYWSRVFGLPEVIVTDPGREFLAEFVQLATQSGVVVHQTAARAP